MSPPGGRPPATHCTNGHELSGDNLIITSQKRRICRICRNWSKGQKEPAKQYKFPRGVVVTGVTGWGAV